MQRWQRFFEKDSSSSICVRDVIQLERFLMEGSYHKLLQARSKIPSNEYIGFVNMLLDTVRCVPGLNPPHTKSFTADTY